MPQILMLKGLPQAGKTQFCRSIRDFRRISAEDIDRMLGNPYNPDPPSIAATTIRNQLIRDSMRAGFNMVIDDCNLDPNTKEALESLIAEFNSEQNIINAANYYEPYVLSEKHVGIEMHSAIIRDARRADSVGAEIIRKLFYKYLINKPPFNAPVPGLLWSVVCSLDAIALFPNDSPATKWESPSDANVNMQVSNMLKKHADPAGGDGFKVVYITATPELYRPKVYKWLEAFHLPAHMVLMQDASLCDQSEQSTKQFLFNQYVSGHYNVYSVIEDDMEMKSFWYPNGIYAFYVDQRP